MIPCHYHDKNVLIFITHAVTYVIKVESALEVFY